MSKMRRRTCLGVMLAGAATEVATKLSAAAGTTRPIELNCDLAVDPKREQEMLDNFEKIFRPVAMKQPGYIDLKMLKLTAAIQGPKPLKYRFALRMTSEELRQKWIATDAHAKVWPSIENTLTDKNFSINVFEIY
jgi:hypothetical protein